MNSCGFFETFLYIYLSFSFSFLFGTLVEIEFTNRESSKSGWKKLQGQNGVAWEVTLRKVERAPFRPWIIIFEQLHRISWRFARGLFPPAARSFNGPTLNLVSPHMLPLYNLVKICMRSDSDTRTPSNRSIERLGSIRSFTCFSIFLQYPVQYLHLDSMSYSCERSISTFYTNNFYLTALLYYYTLKFHYLLTKQTTKCDKILWQRHKEGLNHCWQKPF